MKRALHAAACEPRKAALLVLRACKMLVHLFVRARPLFVKRHSNQGVVCFFEVQLSPHLSSNLKADIPHEPPASLHRHMWHICM